jgi:hypothetical protein
MFRYDIMRYSARKALTRHGRLSALENLRDHRGKLAATLARHGVRFKNGPVVAPLYERHAEEHKAQSAQSLAAALDVLERSLAASR